MSEITMVPIVCSRAPSNELQSGMSASGFMWALLVLLLGELLPLLAVDV